MEGKNAGGPVVVATTTLWPFVCSPRHQKGGFGYGRERWTDYLLTRHRHQWTSLGCGPRVACAGLTTNQAAHFRWSHEPMKIPPDAFVLFRTPRCFLRTAFTFLLLFVQGPLIFGATGDRALLLFRVTTLANFAAFGIVFVANFPPLAGIAARSRNRLSRRHH